MALLLDLVRLAWLTILLGLIALVPAMLATGRRRPPLTAVLEQLVITLTVTIAAVSLLSPAHLLNPLTLLIAYGLWPVGRWCVRHRRTLEADTRQVAQSLVLKLAVRFENGVHWRDLRERAGQSIAAAAADIRSFSHAAAEPSGAVIMLALLTAVGPLLATAMANTRLATPEAYAELLIAQRLFVAEAGWGAPRIAGDVVAALSVASSIAPVHVIRLLAPLAAGGALVTLLAAIAVIGRSRSVTAMAALVTALMMVAAPIRPIADYLAFASVCLTILFWHLALVDARPTRAVAVAASVLLALSAPPLLMVAGAAVAAMLIAPSLVLAIAGVAWLAAPHTGWQEPMPCALIAAGAAQLLAERLQFRRPPVRIAVAAAIAALALSLIVPRADAARYIEYDAAARQALAIAAQFPKYRWMIVAPIEEWALSYGRGWHMNLHEFVDELGDGRKSYHLPYKVDDVFVFVETRPFAMFADEPHDVPFSALTDPVYRHYRSAAGRASLQLAAYRLSERLARELPGAGVYFDDGRLKIYRFNLR